MARATLVSGSSVSAAAIVTSSVPPNAKITTSNAAATPETPMGMNPPWLVRLLSPGDGAGSRPMSSNTPTTRKASTASTLSSANQNSVSPRVSTRNRLTAVNTAMKISASTHWGTTGHISAVSWAEAGFAAVISPRARITSTSSRQPAR